MSLSVTELIMHVIYHKLKGSASLEIVASNETDFYFLFFSKAVVCFCEVKYQLLRVILVLCSPLLIQ